MGGVFLVVSTIDLPAPFEFEIAVGGLLNATFGNATELYINLCTEKQTDTCCLAVIIGLNSVKLVACAWMCILLWWSFLSKGAAV
ncbi:hypothetical protein CFP56_004038 [Quercus suber]|uniref:Uncharacterized protein n=1 Tax=Quercus suber TaxID=58331 RepID=A0AAW0II49_QUESU